MFWLCVGVTCFLFFCYCFFFLSWWGPDVLIRIEIPERSESVGTFSWSPQGNFIQLFYKNKSVCVVWMCLYWPGLSVPFWMWFICYAKDFGLLVKHVHAQCLPQLQSKSSRDGKREITFNWIAVFSEEQWQGALAVAFNGKFFPLHWANTLQKPLWILTLLHFILSGERKAMTSFVFYIGFFFSLVWILHSSVLLSSFLSSILSHRRKCALY